MVGGYTAVAQENPPPSAGLMLRVSSSSQPLGLIAIGSAVQALLLFAAVKLRGLPLERVAGADARSQLPGDTDTQIIGAL